MSTIQTPLEIYPNHIKEKINHFNQMNKSLPPYINNQPIKLLIEQLKIWRVGTLKVSFKGGDANLHHTIASTASIWSDYGNIKFDFGFNPQTNTYRLCHDQDDSHIRVGFSLQRILVFNRY